MIGVQNTWRWKETFAEHQANACLFTRISRDQMNKKKSERSEITPRTLPFN